MQYKAHRYSWILHNGAIPAGLQVCHTCDNPSCVKPDHLFLGTNRDNVLDSHKKDRHAKFNGEASSRAKLTWNIVEYMRTHRTIPATTLAQQFGVHPCTVRRIWRNRGWLSTQSVGQEVV